MKIFGRFLTVFLLSFLFTAPSTADIIDVKMRSDKRDNILLSEFKYCNTGHLSVAVSSVGISSIPVTSQSIQPDPSRVGLFLLSNEFRDRYVLEFKRNPGLCALDNKFVINLFTFQNISTPPQIQSSFNKSYNVTYPGLYSLYLVNCNDMSLVTMDVHAEFYNTNDNGTTRDYLAHWQPQPSFFFRFFLIYLCFLVCWIALCFKNKQGFQMIHLMMGVLLVLTLLYFIYAAADQQDLKLTGTHPRQKVHELFNMFQFMRNVVFFMVVVLIGAGWCFWKRLLPVWEVVVLTIVILLQIWANLILVRGSDPYSSGTFITTDVISCIIVLLHACGSAALSIEEATDPTSIVWSFGSLKDNIDEARTAFFPIVVTVYLITTGYMFIFLENFTGEFKVAQEISCLVFSLVMYYMYRPLPFLLDDGEENRKGSLDLTGV